MQISNIGRQNYRVTCTQNYPTNTLQVTQRTLWASFPYLQSLTHFTKLLKIETKNAFGSLFRHSKTILTPQPPAPEAGEIC
jgi:hypothetical protein